MTPFRSALAMWAFAAAILAAVLWYAGPSYVIGSPASAAVIGEQR